MKELMRNTNFILNKTVTVDSYKLDRSYLFKPVWLDVKMGFRSSEYEFLLDEEKIEWSFDKISCLTYLNSQWYEIALNGILKQRYTWLTQKKTER